MAGRYIEIELMHFIDLYLRGCFLPHFGGSLQTKTILSALYIPCKKYHTCMVFLHVYLTGDSSIVNFLAVFILRLLSQSLLIHVEIELAMLINVAV